jgi:NADH:ubiquinone oxidoreductase subunit K
MSAFVILFVCLLFFIGSFGMFLSRKHLIIILISLELMLLAININFVVFSVILDDLLGQIYAITILAIAAAETSLGLALLIIYYRLRGGISIDLLSLIKS